MKKVSLLCLFLVSFLSFTSMLTSCDDEDGSIENYYISMATVRTGDNSSFWLQLDNGKLLWPAATMVPWYHPTDSQRVIANYSLLSGKQGVYDYFVRLNMVRKVLKKSIVDLNKDTPSNDPLRFEDPLRVDHVWIGGGYVNLIFTFRGGNVSPHYINLLTNSIQNPDNPGPDGVWKLELRHNAMGDNGSMLFSGIVSFVIPSSITTSVVKNIEISYKNFNNQTWKVNLPYEGRSAWTPVPAAVNKLEELSEGKFK